MPGNARVYGGFRWTVGDLDNPALGIMLPTINRSLHIASFADQATDWNVAAPVHPTVYLHSETTPATDYASMAHDADNLTIRVFGGGMILTPVTDVMISDTTGLIIGATAQVAVAGVLPEFQQHGTTAADTSALTTRWSADATGPVLYLAKSRSATIGTFGIITTGDVLGGIEAFGDDGVDFNSNANASAAIRFVAFGTIAADRIPGRIQFLLATNAAPSVLTEAVRIDGDGTVNFRDTTGMTIGAIGGSQAVGGINPALNIDGTALGDSSISLQRWSADANAPGLFLAKSRGASTGTFTIIVTGDVLGTISAYGADGVDFNSNANASAEIRFASSGTIAADRIPGAISLWTATDAAPSVLTQRVTITNAGLVDMLFTARIGVAGTRTGTLGISGATSGTVTVTVGAAAGTWTMQLPAAVGAAGQQLTDAAGDGICTWAAASLGAWKNDLGILDPHEALQAVVNAPTHKFTYNAAVMPAGQWAPLDRMVGVFAEEAPWAMHGERADGHGIAFSNINSFGYARAAIQALYEDLQGALAEISGLRGQLAALNA